MKIKFALAGMLFCLGAAQLQAQVGKGEFVFGFNPVTYAITNEHSVMSYSNTTQSEPMNDSASSKSNSFGLSLNIWGGYFLSDKVMLGLALTPSSTIAPYASIFRYYFTKPDSGKFDFYFQANVGANYSNNNLTENRQVYGNSVVTYSNTSEPTTSVNAVAGIGGAYNTSKHFGMDVWAGYSISYSESTVPDYTETTSGNPPVSEPGYKSESFYNSLSFRLGLHYYL